MVKTVLFLISVFVFVSCKPRQAPTIDRTKNPKFGECTSGYDCGSGTDDRSGYDPSRTGDTYPPYGSSDSRGPEPTRTDTLPTERPRETSPTDTSDPIKDAIESIADLIKKDETGTSTPSKGGDSTPPPEPTSEPRKAPTTPSVNACDMASNKSMNINGYSFNMTNVTYEVFATVGSTGYYGNFAANFGGGIKSVLNSFSYHVRNGSLTSSGRYNMSEATVSVSGVPTPFASISSGSYSLSGRSYTIKYDLRAAGACLAIYGDYSGGNAVLVMP